MTSVLDKIGRERLVMIVRNPSTDAALRVIEAAVDGGVVVVEVTFSVPDAAGLIERLANDDRVLVGAGTVTTADQARAAVDAGARFMVSPGLDVSLVEFGVEQNVPMIPGTFTPTEALTAISAGATAIKLFPAGTLGVGHLASLLAPMPDLRVMPSGGISATNAAAWLAAGAFAVGIGGQLSPASPDIDLPAVTAEARRIVTAVRSA